jgi:hypothetical protein
MAIATIELNKAHGPSPCSAPAGRFPLDGRTSVNVTKLTRDENRIVTVELS